MTNGSAAPVRRVVGVCGALAGVVFLWRVMLHPAQAMPLFDLAAYRTAGERVLAGVPLYDSPLTGTVRGVFEFVYPPFAALLFAPLAGVGGPAFVLVALIVGLGLLAVLVWRTTDALGADDPVAGWSPWAVAGLCGLLLWCEPVYETVTFGQVNLLVAALVLGDLRRAEPSRWQGLLIGVAAGIKLTPLIFVLYLLVTRRFRAAATAGAGFLGTVLIGLALLPSDSWRFWSGAFADPGRVGVPEHPGNQSLRGLIAVGFGDGPAQRLSWLAGAMLLGALGLWLAARWHRRGAELPAVLLVGLTSTAVSPFSWVHHWVWVAAVLVVLLDRAARRPTPARWAAFGLVAVVGSEGFFSVGARLGLPGWGIGHAYVWLTVGLLVALSWREGRAGHVGRSTDPGGRLRAGEPAG